MTVYLLNANGSIANRSGLQRLTVYIFKIASMINQQEQSIISQFYQERRSRLSHVKHHSLLKRNLQEQHSTSEEPKSQPIGTGSSMQGRRHSAPYPPLPKHHLPSTPNNTRQLHQQAVSLTEENHHRHEKTEHSHKRINIQHYLTSHQEHNKENMQNEANSNGHTHDKSHTAQLIQELEQKLRRKHSGSNRSLTQSQAQPIISITNTSFEFHRNNTMGRQSRSISDRRQSFGTNLHSQTMPVHSTNKSQGSNYEYSRNDDMMRQFSQPREDNTLQYSRMQPSSATLRNSLHNSSGKRVDSLPRKESLQSLKLRSGSVEHNSAGEVNNMLMDGQLENLQENSHPLRETTPPFQPLSTLKLSRPYEDPQQQQELTLLREQVNELKEQLEGIKANRRREAKFIDSIYKMRRTMEDTREDCSLKELWRWIKHLPSSNSTNRQYF